MLVAFHLISAQAELISPATAPISIVAETVSTALEGFSRGAVSITICAEGSQAPFFAGYLVYRRLR